MNKMFNRVFVTSLLWLSAFVSGYSQYTLGGNAPAINNPSGGCYTVTSNIGDQLGWAWRQQTIDVNCPFQISYNISFTNGTNGGADGMCFIIQNQFTNSYPLNIANAGGGRLGYLAFPGNSVMIEFDCWDNDEPYAQDPSGDHIAMFKNGFMNHNDAANRLAPQAPQTAINVPNLENGQNHLIVITWNPTTTTLTCVMDNSAALTLNGTVDMVNMFANTAGIVNVGFAATTGGATNIQRFCPLPDTPVITTLTAATETICPGALFTLDEQALDLTNTNIFSWAVTAGTGNITTPNPAQAGIVDVTGAGAGSVIQVTYTDNCGHIYTRDYTVQPSALPTVTVNNLSICAGANWTLTPAPGGNYNSLSWVVTHPDGTVDPPVVGNTLSGLDAATVTVTPSITGCASAGNPVTVTVSATSLNPFDAGGPITHCIDAANPTYIHTAQSSTNPLGFVSQPGFPLTWSITAPNTGNIVNAAANGTFLEVDQTGTYTLTATGGPGCVVTDDVYIELVTNPTVTIVPGGALADEFICPNTPMDLSIVGNYDAVQWTDQLGNVIAPTIATNPNVIEITSDGIYSVEITIGTCTATDNITITESPAIAPNAGGDQLGICTNGNITLNGSTETNYTASWTITSPTGNIVSGQNTTDPVVSASGTYMLTVTNPQECQATASAIVELLPVPEVALGNNFQVCPNLPFNIALNNTNCPNLNLVTSILWSDNTTGNSFTSQVASNSNQTVSVTLNINTCSASDNVVVSAFVPPLWDLGQPQTVCGDQPFVINSSESVLWTSSANSTTTTGTSYTQNNPSPGTETLTATLTYGNGCIIFDNLDIEIIEPFFVNLPTTADFCEGSAIQIDAGNTETWSNGDVGPSTMANETGILTATYTDGPCTSQDQMTITMTYLPDIEWTDNTTYCEGTTVTLGAPGSHATSFYWSTGETTETIVVSESGYYTLTASNNCATVNRDIVLDFESCESYAFIPNTFTPDKDGINEVWQPIIYNAKSYEVFIYNRWGDVIYHSTDPNENWLGESHEGQHYVQDGVYGYRIILESPQREKKEYFGYFRMLR